MSSQLNEKDLTRLTIGMVSLIAAFVATVVSFAAQPIVADIAVMFAIVSFIFAVYFLGRPVVSRLLAIYSSDEVAEKSHQ